MDKLASYDGDRGKIAENFGVSERTVIRWLQYYELYQPRANYGCNKLSLKKAREIRKLHEGGASMKDLASKYKVTFSSISRIIHKITYKEFKVTADVWVIYNPH